MVAVVIQKNKQNDEEVLFKQYGSPDEVRLENRVLQSQLAELPSGYIGFPLSGVDLTLIKLFPGLNQVKSIGQVSDGASTKEAYDILNHIEQGADADSSNSTNTHDAKIYSL